MYIIKLTNRRRTVYLNERGTLTKSIKRAAVRPRERAIQMLNDLWDDNPMLWKMGRLVPVPL